MSGHIFFQRPIQGIGIQGQLEVCPTVLIADRKMMDLVLAAPGLVPEVDFAQSVVLVIPGQHVGLHVA